MNNKTSLNTFQQQCAFQEDVNVRIGEKLTSTVGKTIYQAEWLDRQEDSPIVILEFKGNDVSDEVLLNITLDHPHIIKTYGTVKPKISRINTRSILLVQEYAKDGDLGRLLNERFFIPSESVLVEIFLQISNAMMYLSEHDIIHGDLACRNVLVMKSHPDDSKRNLVKLIDFGLTRDQSISSNVKIDFPVRYAALEIIRSNGRVGYSEKSDVYSFAVLMWEAYCSEKRMPYDYISDDNEVCRRKLNGEKLIQPVKCDPKIWTLMLECWNDRPDDRPNFRMIYTRLQNLKISSNTSNSISRSSEHVASLFNSKHDGRSQYTDGDSHLNNYNEKKSTFDLADHHSERARNQDDRGSVDDLSRTISLESSFPKINNDNYGPCEFCNQQYSIHELDIHQSNCLDNPHNHRTTFSSTKSDKNHEQREHNPISLPSPSSSRYSSKSKTNTNNSSPSPSTTNKSRIHSSLYRSNNDVSLHQKKQIFSSTRSIHQDTSLPKISTEKKSTELHRIQLPCEICKKLIDTAAFVVHQKQCNDNDKRRVENERIRIEKEQSIREVDCMFCYVKYPVAQLDNHQNNCELNPEKIFDQRSSTRSISFPDLRTIPSIPQATRSRQKSAQPPKNPKQSQPTVHRNQRTSTAGKKSEGNKEPSRFSKFLSRLFSFKKKQ